MASPLRVPAAVAGSERTGSGNKENISEDGGTVFNRPALQKEVASSAKGRKKKSSGFNLRKSIAWNPAFFTEDGVLDNSELSVLTGSELMVNGSPSSGVVNGMTSPLCRSGRYGNTNVPKEVAHNSCGKLSAKHRCTENRGRRLFSAAKTSQMGERKESAGTQTISSARSIQKGIPRVPAGSIQKKVPSSTSTAHMSRIPKKPLSSLPMSPRSTTPVTTVSKSNKKLAPVKTEHVHRVPGLLPKSKIDSGPSTMPVIAAIHDGINGSVKSKNPQISISKFGGTASTYAKPSALRMPSPSVGFFTQENAHMSHDNAAERNMRRFSAVNTSSVVKPPIYKQYVDLKSGLHLSKVLSTNCATDTDLVSLPVTTDSNPDTLLTSEKRSLSKIISAYSAKSRDANYQERPEAYCLLAGSGATPRPLSLEKNDGSGSSMPIVYNDTSRVEGRGIIKEIKPAESEATCFSTIEAAEDSCSLKATCSSTKPTVRSKSSPSYICSQSNDISWQGKTESGSIAATDLENSYVGERALAVSLSEGESSTLDVDPFQSSDLCDHHNTEPANFMESMECTLCADQMPPSDRNSVSIDSLYDEGKSDLSEEPNTDCGTELATNNASAVTEDPLLHVGCEHNHNFKRIKCLPVKLEAPMACVERSVEPNMEDKMVFGSKKLLAQEVKSHIEKDKAVDTSRTNTIRRDHLKNLVPFTEEWLAVMESCGQEVLEQKSGAVQNSPPDKTAPEPSPWSPVKRKAQDVGPFECTKYSKSVQTCSTS